jgi:parvulin-like peptidyl-prolyl isomerase
VSEEDLDAERESLLRSLDRDDEDRAVRLLRGLRERRGLGDKRFDALLERNAQLRKLVDDARAIEITRAELRIAHAAAYGPKAQVRLAMLRTMAEARDLRRAVRAAAEASSEASAEARFIELAVARSIDPSSSRGGLLPPVSPADTAYPPAFRQALSDLMQGQPQRGDTSAVVALDEGFAVLQWVRGVEPRGVAFASVRDELAEALRRRKQREAMDNLAMAIISEAEVTILDPSLDESWRRRLRRGGEE